MATSYEAFNPYVKKENLSMSNILSKETTTSIERDGDGDITKLIYGSGHYCMLGYSGSKLVTSLKFYDSGDVLLEEWTYSYDGNDDLTSVVRS